MPKLRVAKASPVKYVAPPRKPFLGARVNAHAQGQRDEVDKQIAAVQAKIGEERADIEIYKANAALAEQETADLIAAGIKADGDKVTKRKRAAAVARRCIEASGEAIGKLEARLVKLRVRRERLVHMMDTIAAHDAGESRPAGGTVEAAEPVEVKVPLPPMKPRKDGKARRGYERGLEEVYDAVRGGKLQWLDEAKYIDEAGLIDFGAIGENTYTFDDAEKLTWVSVFDAIAAEAAREAAIAQR